MDDDPLDPLGPFRPELFALCYRMLGSHHDAEDVLQEIALRAARGRPAFEGRSSLRTWLHRIAVNACLTAAARAQRRVLPIEYGPQAHPGAAFVRHEDVPWLGPTPTDPHQRAEELESVELAFVAAVAHLTPNQRAALILFDVLGYSAAEIASLMDTTVASVTSALQRARERIRELAPAPTQQRALSDLGDAGQRDLVARYTDALRRHDVDALLALLTDDATWSMPPMPNWYRGHAAIAEFVLQGPFTQRWQHVLTVANGQLAVGCYERDSSGVFRAYALDVLTVRDTRIAAVVGFLDPGIFPSFGLDTAMS